MNDSLCSEGVWENRVGNPPILPLIESWYKNTFYNIINRRIYLKQICLGTWKACLGKVNQTGEKTCLPLWRVRVTPYCARPEEALG